MKLSTPSRVGNNILPISPPKIPTPTQPGLKPANTVPILYISIQLPLMVPYRLIGTLNGITLKEISEYHTLNCRLKNNEAPFTNSSVKQLIQI